MKYYIQDQWGNRRPLNLNHLETVIAAEPDTSSGADAQQMQRYANLLNELKVQLERLVARIDAIDGGA